MGHKRKLIELKGDFSKIPNTQIFAKSQELKDGDIILLHSYFNIDLDTAKQIYNCWVKAFPNNTIILDVGINHLEIKEK